MKLKIWAKGKKKLTVIGGGEWQRLHGTSLGRSGRPYPP
jgi:hypothetical protein